MGTAKTTTFLSDEMARYYEDMWVEEQLKILSKKKYERLIKMRKFGETNKSFWQIVSKDKKDKWDSINFHFELKLSGTDSLTQCSEIPVVVHLESQHISPQLNEKARAFFAKEGAVIEGNTIKEVCGKKLDGVVKKPDFSSEEAAKRTIEEIIGIINLESYQKCAKIANAFLKTLSE